MPRCARCKKTTWYPFKFTVWNADFHREFNGKFLCANCVRELETEKQREDLKTCAYCGTERNMKSPVCPKCGAS